MTSTPQSGRPASAAIESSSGTPIQASAAASTSQLPELPWAFIDCPTDTLVVLIAHMLDLLCQHNDQVVLTPDALTRFHSRAPPGISVIEYLRRIVKYTNLEVSSTFLLMSPATGPRPGPRPGPCACLT